MSGAPRPLVGSVSPADIPALLALFERAGCPCYCQYWTFPGDQREWQFRMALESDQSAAAFASGLSAQQVRGVVARSGSEIVGWARLESATNMGKLYAGRLYKGLECLQRDPEGVFTVGCFLVDPGWRQQGVAKDLLAGLVELSRREGARCLEAFPRRAENVPGEHHWLGPPQIYEEAGFSLVHDFEPYPVLRLEFGAIELEH